MIANLDIAICCILVVSLFGFSFLKSTPKSQYFTFKAEYWLIGPSLMAANIGSEHFVGQIAAASSTGMGVVLYEWYATYLLLLLGWVFTIYYKNVSTVPEYLEQRFNKTTRILCAFITLFAATVVKISASVFAASILFETILGLNSEISVATVLVLTGIYTAVGGLSAIMYTDIAQLAIFLIGGISACIVCLNLFGGLGNLIHMFYQTNNENLLKLFRGLDDPNYSPVGMLIGQGLASLWYWCLDQEMCQRANSGKTIDDSRLGTVIAGYLKLSTFWIIIVPGFTARMLYESCIHGVEVPNNQVWCSLDMSNGEEANKAYAYLMLYIFPSGLTGIILGAIFASMTASLSACFHASSTIFSIDIYRRTIRRNASDSELVLVGRLFTVAMIVVGILWTRIIKTQHDSIYLVTQMVMNHISPVLTTVVVWGMISPRITELAANFGLVIGVVLGGTRLAIHFAYKQECVNASTPTHLGGPLFQCMHFNHFAILLSGVVTIILWTISLVIPQIQEAKIKSKDFKTMMLFEDRRSKRFQSITKLLSIVLFFGMTGLILKLSFEF